MTRSFLLGLGVGLILLVGLVGYQRFSHSCPCGFTWDYLTNGCQIDQHPPPCGPGSGGNSPGNNPGGGSNGTAVIGPTTPFGNCSIRVADCSISPDWSAIQFTLSDGGALYTPPLTGQRVTLAIRQRDKNAMSCTAIKGTIETTMNAPTKIPFNAGALAGIFPIISSSAGGTAPGALGLEASFNDACHATLTETIAFPAANPECSCRVSFTRD